MFGKETVPKEDIARMIDSGAPFTFERSAIETRITDNEEEIEVLEDGFKKMNRELGEISTNQKTIMRGQDKMQGQLDELIILMRPQ